MEQTSATMLEAITVTSLFSRIWAEVCSAMISRRRRRSRRGPPPGDLRSIPLIHRRYDDQSRNVMAGAVRLSAQSRQGGSDSLPGRGDTDGYSQQHDRKKTAAAPDIDGMRTAAAAPVMQHRDNEQQAGNQNRTGGDRHRRHRGAARRSQESEEPSGDGSRHQYDHGQ